MQTRDIIRPLTRALRNAVPVVHLLGGRHVLGLGPIDVEALVRTAFRTETPTIAQYDVIADLWQADVIRWEVDNAIFLAEPYATIAEEYPAHLSGRLSLAEFIILDPFERGLAVEGR
jgi:hypothetical protein